MNNFMPRNLIIRWINYISFQFLDISFPWKMQSAKTQEEIGILNKPISFKEIESIINVLTQKAPNTDKFSRECYQIFKGELTPVLSNFLETSRGNTS